MQCASLAGQPLHQRGDLRAIFVYVYPKLDRPWIIETYVDRKHPLN